MRRLLRLFGITDEPPPTGSPPPLRSIPEATPVGTAAETANPPAIPSTGPCRPKVLEEAAARLAPRAPVTPTGAAETGEPPAADTAEPASPVEATPIRERLGEQLMATFGMRQAKLDPGTTGARALGLLAVLVVLAAAGLAWWSQPRPEPVAAPRPAAPSLAASAAATGVVVAVAGKVRRPGLVTLSPGARVADAIEAAGGVLPGTDIGYLNLARKVTDGELIVVGETPPPGAGADGGGPGAGGDAATKVNLNTATLQQLDTLPGVGTVLAQRILDYREDHGGFRSVDELRQVDGIGPARFEQLKDLVTV